ncbi:Putative helicase, P-loop containing nucleoside triphosphate hydrolase [Septoria linicola]|uniref:RNA helicase n=1 Tax=Septoria linicola TaxID=215465 RepID=A0A9Q9B9G9_9PEZI|nr:Putative helicase, P-loop containing nucleoside triphosphate hydrolase [Septoria linicola]
MSRFKNLDGSIEAQTAPKKRKREEKVHNPHLAKKQKLHAGRTALPIWPRAKEIRNSLSNDKDILILTGETGSGKSTQVPQFLLDASWCSGKIAVTQPRRVAAISLARRVAEEMGSPLGSSSPASKVGYSVRFDDNTSPGTRIKYLTEGMLLQEMLRDPKLGQYSCVVVDEVHERSVDVDLILGFLKGLVQERRANGKALKVVVMSATADVESLRDFFSRRDSPSDSIDQVKLENASASGNDAKVEETEDSWEGFAEEETHLDSDSPRDRLTLCHVEGRQYPVKLQYTESPSEDVIDAALQRIFQIHCKEPMPGDILVFLTGQEAITGLQRLVEEFASSLTTDFPKMLVLPLYAALPQQAQQRIFERAPPNTRKVILSTNIAETSVTVPGVRFVIDTGKAKIKQFRPRLGIESLLIKPISRSSADQRKGRAGREAPGQCFRLFTEADYKSLEQNTKPEILHCDLTGAVLKMKARGIEDVFAFSFLTPPSREAMARSLMQLHQLGCISDSGTITPTGRAVARLPLPPPLGRVILESAKHDCLLETIDIVAALDVESIFLPAETEEAREKATESRSQLFSRRGDHITLLNAVRGYADENSNRKLWATDRMISHRSMQNVMDVRKQLRVQTKSLLEIPTVRESISEDCQDDILKCFLRGFSGNVARLCPDKSYKTLSSNQVVAIHPSSVLYGAKREAIMFNDFTFTTKPWARKVSAIELKWLEEVEYLTQGN